MCVFQMRTQESHETLANYITEIKIMSKKCDFEKITPKEIIRDRIISGMSDDNLRQRLLAKEKLTLYDVLRTCKNEETAIVQADTFKKDTVNAVYNRRKETKQYKEDSNRTNRYREESNRYRDESKSQEKCKYCGRIHEPRQCPAYNSTCHECGKKNHYAKMCRNKIKNINRVFRVQKVETPKIYSTHKMKTEETITLKTEWETELTLQMDTGANVNVVPLKEYVRISGDQQKQHIKKNQFTQITAFGDKHCPILGERVIRVYRGKNSIQIRILIMEGGQFHAILGRTTFNTPYGR